MTDRKKMYISPLMKLIELIVVVVLLTVIGCAREPNSRPVVMPVAGGCHCELHCDIKQHITGNIITGNMRLLVRNYTKQTREISLPDQEAQILSAGVSITYHITGQEPQTIAPGMTETFVIPFAMSEDALRATREIIIVVNGTAHILRLNITE